MTLETKTAAMESTSTTEAGKVSTLESTVAAEEAKVITLETKTAALESKSTTEAGKVSALESTVVAEEAKVVTLETKTAALESTSTTEAGKVSTLETTLAAEQAKTTTLETTLAAEQAKTTTLESTLAAEQAKTTTLEKILAAEQIKIKAIETTLAKINSKCLDDSSRRLESKPCGIITSTDTSDTGTDNTKVLVQTLTFTGVQASDISSSTKRINLEMKIANALDVKAIRVKIIKIANKKVTRQRRLLTEEKSVEIVYEVELNGEICN